MNVQNIHNYENKRMTTLFKEVQVQIQSRSII